MTIQLDPKRYDVAIKQLQKLLSETDIIVQKQTTIIAETQKEFAANKELVTGIVGEFEILKANVMTTDVFLADSVNAATGSFSKYLTGVNIVGDNITAGTLSTDRLIIRDPDTNKGILYEINNGVVDQTNLSAEELKRLTLDGKVITAKSITAEQINVFDLFAQNIISTGNFNMGGKGALVYDKTNDTISMRAKQISAATSDGLILSDLLTGELGKNALVNSEGFFIRDGNTPLASFDENDIYLGNESPEAKIHLCGDEGLIESEVLWDDWRRLTLCSKDSIALASEGQVGLTASYIDPNDQTVFADAWLTLTSRQHDHPDQPENWVQLRAEDSTSYEELMFLPGQILLTTLESGDSSMLKLEPSGLHLDKSIYLPNYSAVYGETVDSGYRRMIYTNTSNNVIIGYDNYLEANGNTHLYGNKIRLYCKNGIGITSPTAGLIDREYGVNKVLWSGSSYMTASQTATLDEAISAQPHGVVLAFSRYSSSAGTAANEAWNYFFIPKWHGINQSGKYAAFVLAYGQHLHRKILYISDTQITGQADNSNTNFTFHGQQVTNANFVLRAVIGV